MKNNKSVVLWGCGKNLKDNINKISRIKNVRAICDSDKNKWGKHYYGFECIPPEQLQEDDFIVFTILDRDVVLEIVSQISNEYMMLRDVLGEIQLCEEKQFMNNHENELSNDMSEWNGKLAKYIGLHVPATTCNLQCSYCYIRQKEEFYHPPKLYHHPQYIRWALSRRKLGGQALIGICGEGETLLCDKINEVIYELLLEGHYLHIVTNGTLTNKIYELLNRVGGLTSHLFFKFSFHYEELKKRGMLDTFVNTINYVDSKGASYTIELTTDDNLIDRIDEIKEFSIRNFGAYPHVTIARDDTKFEKPIFTRLSYNDYYKIWSTFDSELFNVKWEWFGKRVSHCKAGLRSLYIDLDTGSVNRCLHRDNVDNIYEIKDGCLKYDTIEDKCFFSYCYNNHSYLTLGIDPTIEITSYAEVRDRVKEDGSHWVKEEMYKFFEQKLYDANDTLNVRKVYSS